LDLCSRLRREIIECHDLNTAKKAIINYENHSRPSFSRDL
jgi:hypothetical protein